MEVLQSDSANIHDFTKTSSTQSTKNNISVDVVGCTLLDESLSLATRFRALFILRNLKCDTSVKYIAKCFGDSSALLKHELAYCLGQMGNITAIPYLTAVLEDKNQEAIVRHEAAEALGAIGDSSSMQVLEKYEHDEEREVAETCMLALKRIKWLNDKAETIANVSTFDSIDPAPASSFASTDVDILKSVLVNETFPLWERYRAMFTLRNLSVNDERAVKALASGLKCANSGALFRHEIAYVLGQLQSPVAIEELRASLQDVAESPMVRHECAEALGSIATPECMEIVRSFANDSERIVRESCEVALDMAEYEQSDDFQYAKIE